MFKKIKEFIIAFKNAYNTINVIKIDAKRIIEDYLEKYNISKKYNKELFNL